MSEYSEMQILLTVPQEENLDAGFSHSLREEYDPYEDKGAEIVDMFLSLDSPPDIVYIDLEKRTYQPFWRLT